MGRTDRRERRMNEIKTITEQQLENEARRAELTLAIVDTEEVVKRLAHSMIGVPSLDSYTEARVLAAQMAMSQAVARAVSLEED